MKCKDNIFKKQKNLFLPTSNICLLYEPTNQSKISNRKS